MLGTLSEILLLLGSVGFFAEEILWYHSTAFNLALHISSFTIFMIGAYYTGRRHEIQDWLKRDKEARDAYARRTKG